VWVFVSDIEFNLVAVVLIQSFWLILPAYLPNSFAVIFGGGKPVDLGKKHSDGRRIFGDGKTWRGLIAGITCGILIGYGQLLVEAQLDYEDFIGFGPTKIAYIIIILIPVGAMLGDLMGSFIKRRLNKPRGTKLPILDQFDFLIGAWALVLIFNWQWFFERYIYGVNILGLIFILILTLILHRFTNIIGYKIGKKKEPW
jgi:CDP-2,3-bis-(O-geranylgeranyl)-sn-glycerol synthase